MQIVKEIAALGEKAAIIENEVGEKGIDDKLFSGSGLTIKPLFGGCVCCQITGDLLAAIKEIAKEVNPDWLIIEMTGLAVPGSVVKPIRQYNAGHTVCKTVTIVDAERWEILMKALKPLIVSQIKDSDVIVINKTDVAGGNITQVIEEVKTIGGQTPVLCSSPKERLSLSALKEVVRFE